MSRSKLRRTGTMWPSAGVAAARRCRLAGLQGEAVVLVFALEGAAVLYSYAVGCV